MTVSSYFNPDLGSHALAVAGLRINSHVATCPYNGDFSVAKYQTGKRRRRPRPDSHLPFVDGHEAQAVHFPVGEFFGARGVPLLIPADGLLAQIDHLFEAVPLREAVFLLVFGNPIPWMTVAAVIFQRNLRRIESEFGGHTSEHHDCGVRRLRLHA